MKIFDDLVLPESGKTCIKCNVFKSLNEFGTRSRDIYGNPIEHRNDCKECRKLFAKQLREQKKNFPKPDENHRCLGCNKSQEEFANTFKGKTIWCLDHDHKSGKARGYVCQYCNFILGRARDNPEVLTNLAKYLNVDISN